MADVRGVVAALHRLPQLIYVDEQSLLLPQWSTLETVFLHLFRLTPQLSDISSFIQQRQHDRTLERLHPTPASLALARDREALYRQLVVELVYGQLYGVHEGKRRAAKAAGGLLLGESGEGVRVVADLLRRVMPAKEDDAQRDNGDEEEQESMSTRRELDDEKKSLRDERKHADSHSEHGSARKKASLAAPATPDSSDRRPRTAAVSGEKRSADKSKASKPAQPVPAPKSAAARRRADEEKEREAREERDRQRKQQLEEEEKMAEMREMMRQKAVQEAKRSEHTLRNKPLPASPASDVDIDDTETTALRRPLTASARQPVAVRGRMGAAAAGGSGEVVALERQLKEEKEKVAALERRVREMESIVTDGGNTTVGEDGWRQQLLLHAQCEQWRRQCTLMQGVVEGKRQVMNELRTVCEWMREAGKRLRRLEKGGGSGEEEARRLVIGLTAMVSEMMVAADEAVKRVEALDQHTNSLSTTHSFTADPTSTDSTPALPAGVLATLTSFASHLKSAHPHLVEFQQAAHILPLDKVAAAHERRGGKRVSDVAEQLTALADESRKLGQLLLPYSQLSYAASSTDSSTPFSSSLLSSLSATPLSPAERRQLLAVVSEAERSYASDIHTYSTHLSALYPLLSSLVSRSSALLNSVSPLLRQLSSLSSASTSLSSAATASSASKRIAEVMRLVSDRSDEWTAMEDDIRRTQDEMTRLVAEGRERLVSELGLDGQQRGGRGEDEDDRELDDERYELEDNKRWRKPSSGVVEHEQRHTQQLAGRLHNGKVHHQQEWQS